MGYSPRGHKELDTTERLNKCLFTWLLVLRSYIFLEKSLLNLLPISSLSN